MLVYVVLCIYVIFFFKQKTAYEMRISDWSSDVCSSDLRADRCPQVRRLDRRTAGDPGPEYPAQQGHPRFQGLRQALRLPGRAHDQGWRFPASVARRRAARSEEHTSELQSLMRISYAVFCLKKKNKIQIQTANIQNRSRIH